MYKDFVKKQTNQKIKILNVNQSGEYKFKFSLNFAKKDIKREFTTTYMPPQNDVLLKER